MINSNLACGREEGKEKNVRTARLAGNYLGGMREERAMEGQSSGSFLPGIIGHGLIPEVEIAKVPLPEH